MVTINKGVWSLDGSTGMLIPRDTMYDPVSVMAVITPAGQIVPLKVNAEGAIPMSLDVSGDIEIGAVELKNGADDTRASVELDTSKNALYVQSESIAQESGGNLEAIKTAVESFAFDVSGNLLTTESAMQQLNMASAYTYVAVGGVQKVETIKEYPQGAIGGSAAKLTTFTWNPDGTVANITTTDSTV